VIFMNLRNSNTRSIGRITDSSSTFRRFSLFGITSFMVIGIVVAMCHLNTASAQETNSSSVSEQAESTNNPRLDYAGISFKPSNRRDPFLNPLVKKKDSDVDQEIDRGLPPPGIAGTFIAEAVLKGVSIREKGRLAIVKGSGNRAYFLREGDKLFDGYLKTIHRDSITLVRERKMRSGKIITQEVIKRLRTP